MNKPLWGLRVDGPSGRSPVNPHTEGVSIRPVHLKNFSLGRLRGGYTSCINI